MRPWLAGLALLGLAGLAFACQPIVWSPSPNSGSRPVAYLCEDGTDLTALYELGEESVVLLSLPGRDARLVQAISGSGARYVGEGLQWWDRGEEALLAPLAEGEDIASAPGVVCRWAD